MKNAIRLLVLAGALLSVGALAQAQQDWNFTFPTYYYVYTNTASVDFDFTQAEPNPATVQYVGSTGQASTDALLRCISSFVNAPLSVTASDSAAGTSGLGTCEFGPTSVTSSGYSVNWNGLGNADGSLLVVTNATNYKVSVYADTVPTGVTYKLAAAFGSAASNAFTPVPVGLGNATQIATDANDYFTQYQNVYVIPLTFAADVAPTVNPTTTTTTTVTYTASAP